jgi:hypothetical protein
MLQTAADPTRKHEAAQCCLSVSPVDGRPCAQRPGRGAHSCFQVDFSLRTRKLSRKLIKQCHHSSSNGDPYRRAPCQCTRRGANGRALALRPTGGATSRPRRQWWETGTASREQVRFEPPLQTAADPTRKHEAAQCCLSVSLVDGRPCAQRPGRGAHSCFQVDFSLRT